MSALAGGAIWISLMSAVSSVTSTTAAATTSSTSSLMSTDTFLKLLMTQLENQNPLDPMDATEFTKQLATYSQLEQQIETNEKLDTLASQLTSLSTASLVSYLGSTAQLDSADTAYQSGEAEWSYTLPSNASSVTLTVTDSDGNTVYSGSGETGAGAHNFTLDSSDLAGSASEGETLTLSVTATNASGDSLDTTISSFVTIDGFDIGTDDATYQAGSLQFSSDDIQRLQSGAST